MQNADETKFCRSCGADLSSVLAVVAGGKTHPTPALSEKYIDLYGSGLRGLIIGIGFLIVSGAAFGISMRLAVLGLFFLAFAFYFAGTGVSRLIQAKGIKALINREESPAAAATLLTPGQTDYIKPSQSNYETDELVTRPFSVTEHTTKHLKSDE